MIYNSGDYENLFNGYNNFKLQFENDLEFCELLDLYGNVKVLEYRSSEYKNLFYRVQDLLISIRMKLLLNGGN